MAIFGRLGRLHTLASRSIADVFAGHDLQIGEFDVLAALRRSGDPFVMKPTDLARVLMLSPAGMTNRVDRLEAAGWIERQNDPDDRRRTFIWLTPTGRQRLERDAQVLDPDLVGRAFNGLTTQQRQGLIEALAALVASARGIPNPPERERDS